MIGFLGHDHGHVHVPTFDTEEDDENTTSEQHQSHSHHDHSQKNSKQMNVNVKAALIHILGDLLFSLGVLTSSLLITLFPSWTILDPLCTFGFGIIVIFTTLGLVKESVGVIMQRVPPGLDVNKVTDVLLKIPGVVDVSSLHGIFIPFI